MPASRESAGTLDSGQPLLPPLAIAIVGPEEVPGITKLARGIERLGEHAVLVDAGLGELYAQAIAIILVTPLNYLLSRRWSFR